MDTEKQDSNDVLMNTVVTKVSQHEKKIQIQEGRLLAVEKKIEGSPDLSPAIQEIKEDVSSLAADLHNREFPTKDVQELRGQLKTVIPLLQNPAPSKVEHHHHIPKILWLTAGLFLLVCILSTGWILTAGKLADFRASDTKYRKLKLAVDSVSLAKLYQLDSLYRANPDSLQMAVTQEEQLKQERLELLDRIGDVNRKLGEANQNSGKKPAR